MATGHKVEIELKYEVTARGGADRYLVAPELGPFKPVGRIRSVRLEDRYVDTAGWALARAGFAARLRVGSRETLISIKARATSGTRMQRREEIEGPADAAKPPNDWPESEARTVLLGVCGSDPLVELLTIRQLRRVRRLQAGETRAEMSLDEVEVFGDDRLLDTFEELEVELRKGAEEPLTALADLFDHGEDVVSVSRSKLDRAIEAVRAAMPRMSATVQDRWRTAPMELLDSRPAATRPKKSSSAEAAAGDSTGVTAPVEPGDGLHEQPAPPSGLQTETPHTAHEKARRSGPRTLGIVAEDSLPEAARKVLHFHFAKMQNREAGTRNGSDSEDLHDMRVATRRMRAAWRVFDGAFKAGRTKRLRRRLENLSDKLGAVRDLDVLIEGLQAYRVGLDEDQQPGLDPLLSVWRRQRAVARKQLIAELDSGGYAAFNDEMEEFLAAGSNAAATVPSPTIPHRVRDRAPSQLWAAYETVRAYELVLPWADIETIHELRIATKWLRYTLEFFGETLGPDGPRLLGRVSALQEFLGLLHDADVAVKLARDVLVARAGELSHVETDAIGAYLHSREREVARLRRSLGPVWRAVNGAPFRRALGRAAAAL